MAILSFADKTIEAFFFEKILPRKVGWIGIKKVVRRKLVMVDAAEKLDDLKAPPSNRLERLHGNFEGFYSIRINDQWRVIFKWNSHSAGPSETDVIDYH